MSIIGIILAVVGLYFGLSFMVAGVSDEEIGLGFITFALNCYFLALSIVALVKSKQLANLAHSAKTSNSTADESSKP